jgi:hypothetical protein
VVGYSKLPQRRVQEKINALSASASEIQKSYDYSEPPCFAVCYVFFRGASVNYAKNEIAPEIVTKISTATGG